MAYVPPSVAAVPQASNQPGSNGGIFDFVTRNLQGYFNYKLQSNNALNDQLANSGRAYDVTGGGTITGAPTHPSTGNNLILGMKPIVAAAMGLGVVASLIAIYKAIK